MSDIKIVPISSPKDIRKFVHFRNKLYKKHPYAVPTLEIDEILTLNLEKNPASEFCIMQCFLAYNGQGDIVGRICGIINHRANETWSKNEGRFGFFDFIEDIEVARALLSAVEEWLRERGKDTIHGPLGFTDMDPEGMLIEGFDQLGTMATLYNHAYYPQYMEQLGYSKDVDWIEFKITIPEVMPERITKMARIVAQKNNLRIVKCKTTGDYIKYGWATKIFELINKEYAKLYGFTAMTQNQIDYYVKMYIKVARVELLCLIADESDNLVGFGIGMPSLSSALQRSNGRLLPFGWVSILRALKGKKSDIVDLMLIAIDEQYQNKGLTAMILQYVTQGAMDLGAKYAESNIELENNETIHKQWSVFEHVQHKRRRAFTKKL